MLPKVTPTLALTLPVGPGKGVGIFKLPGTVFGQLSGALQIWITPQEPKSEHRTVVDML